MVTLVAAGAVFVVLVFVHELGHLLAARLCGVRVEAFSIGIGPVVARIRRGPTEYRVSAIPFGGYVRLAGFRLFEDPDDGVPEHERFSAKTRTARMAILLAGPAASIVLGLALVTAARAADSDLLSAPPSTRVDVVHAGSPAWIAGLRPGDDVVAAETMSFLDLRGLAALFSEQPGTASALIIRRGAAELTIPIQIPDDGNLRSFGIGALPAWLPVDGTYRDFLMGPVAIGWMSGHVLREFGAWALVELTGLLSLAIGLFNLLPVPPLDGGHAGLLAIEAVRRRDFSRRFRVATLLTGLAAVLVLLIATVIVDLQRMIAG